MIRFTPLRRAITLASLFAMLGATLSAQETTGTAASAPRIVSLNGANTELLYALGVGSQLVGRDDSAIYPKEAAALPSVGYQFQLNAEGVLSLKPTLVIGRTDVRPATVIEQVKAAGVPVELIPEPENLDQAKERITTLGALVDRKEEAGKLVTELQQDIKTFEARKAELGEAAAKKAMFIYLRGPKTTFVLGNETNPGRMLELVGAENAMPAVKNTAPVTAEAVIAAAPEVIVTFTHGLESVGGVEGLLKLPGVSLTPAGKSRRIIVMDDLYLGGFTNRAGKAALDLLNALTADGVSVVESR